jgi:hypothetical protein
VRVPRLYIPGLPFVLLFAAFALYSPILIEHSDLITSPRQIYVVTRVGYGLESFLSTLCVYIGFIILLFQPKQGRLRMTAFVLLAMIIIFIHGSKGQIFAFLLIWLYFVAFVRGRRFGVGRLFWLGLVSSLMLSALFYVTFPQELGEELIEAVASYSAEYTRNATLVIDDGTLDPQMGRLAAENEFYALIPRQIFPDKPRDFGYFWLANRYFPSRFQDEAGAPTFGLGALYADFGPFAIFYYALSNLLSGMALKILVTRMQQRPDAGTFILLLSFLDVPLLPTGLDTPLVVYYLIALIVKSLSPPVIERREPQPTVAEPLIRPLQGGPLTNL